MRGENFHEAAHKYNRELWFFAGGEKVEIQNKDCKKGNDSRRTKDTQNEFRKRRELTNLNIRRNLLQIINFLFLA